MKTLFAVATLIFLARAANSQVFQVDSSGNAKASNTLNAPALNATGTAGGQVAVVSGNDQQSVASGFSLQAPQTITNETQVVVPQLASSGLWYGIKATLPTATVTVAGGIVTGVTVTNAGANMPTAPAIFFSGAGCNPCAAGTANMTGTYPYLSLSSVSITNSGANYTGAVTINFVSPAGTANMMNLLFSPGLLVEIPNNTTTAPLQDELVILSSGATFAPGSTFTGVEGICTANCTTSGNAQVARAGLANCIFDGSATIGNYVQMSTTAGKCTDAGSTYPSSHQVLGRVISGSGTKYLVLLYPMSGAYAVTTNSLSQFAATSSAQLAGVISDETGSGSLVFGTSPVLTTPQIAQINDPTFNGEVLALMGVSSATDFITLVSGAAGTPGIVQVGAAGTDTNITLQLRSKGTGNLSMFLSGTEDYRFQSSGLEQFVSSGGLSWTSGAIGATTDTRTGLINGD